MNDLWQRQSSVNFISLNNVVQMAAMLLLVKCYDKKKVKSLVDLTIINVVGSWGGKPKTNQS